MTPRHRTLFIHEKESRRYKYHGKSNTNETREQIKRNPDVCPLHTRGGIRFKKPYRTAPRIFTLSLFLSMHLPLSLPAHQYLNKHNNSYVILYARIKDSLDDEGGTELLLL